MCPIMFVLLLFLLPSSWGMEDVLVNPVIECAPLKTTCSCSRGDENYELQCPNSEEINVLVKYAPNDYLDIDCLENPSWNLDTLPSLEAQGIEKLSFRNCTLPSRDFGTLITKFGLQSLHLLKIELTNFENVTLTREYFGVLSSSLRQLNLAGNGLSNLNLTVFEDMSNLQSLDLNSNGLVELESRHFRHLPELLELDLSRNLLENIPSDAFEGLSKMRRLHLWSNRLTTLSEKTFASMISLQSLELSINKLTSLSDGIFHNLAALEEISLRANNITNLRSNLFTRNTNLKKVRIESNEWLQTLPDGLFSNLTALVDVWAHTCGLQDLPEDLFRGSTNIVSILLRGNQLRSLPEDIFFGLDQLERLELQHNRIEAIPEKLFESLSQLRVLDLSNNSIKVISRESFMSLQRLEELYLKANDITEMAGSSFYKCQELIILDLSHNALTLLETESPLNFYYSDSVNMFDNLHYLEELDISYNKIKVFQMQWMLNKSKFRRLSLQHNEIDYIEFSDFQTTSLEKTVDVHLDHNHLEMVDFSGAAILARSNPNGTRFNVQLAGNPWRCDCRMYDFLRYHRLELEPEVRDRVEFRSNEDEPMRCANPPEYRDYLISTLPSNALTCPLRYPEDITSCPEACTCHYRPHGNVVIVDCAGRNITSLPPLNKNNNKPLAVTMEGVGWNASRDGLEVWAQNNRIERLGRWNGSDYDNVTVLDVSGNNVSAVDWLPTSLKVINLNNNSLQSLSEDILSSINGTTNITLQNNPWKCNCESVSLSNFIRDHLIINENIRCDGTGLLLRKLTQSELCQSNANVILIVSLSVLLPLLLVAFMAALYYRYQRPVKVFLFAQPLTRWLVAQQDLDKDKLYDAFICYAHEDEDYVEKILKELEGGEQPYRVCIHRRDWMPGAMITDQIHESVRQSRRTIVVLSPAFVRSEWARMEFRTAHASDLKEGRARLIVILHGKLDPKVLEEDEELRAYCSTKTYLRHDDVQFWDKLRYAMPHRSSKPLTSSSNNGGAKISRLGQIMVNIERQDLCATPTTPNNGTTPPAVTFGTESLLRRLDPMDFIIKGGRRGEDVGGEWSETTATA